jgi:hypothetical protein
MWAFSVAKLTEALTPSTLFRVFSMFKAHEEQVMPLIDRSIVCCWVTFVCCWVTLPALPFDLSCG